MRIVLARRCAIILLLFASVGWCAAADSPLDAYVQLRTGDRPGADGYIAYLRSQPRFKELLADIPPRGIILYSNQVPKLLAKLGYDESGYRSFDTGSATINMIYHVLAREGRAPAFVINVGQPGAGGVSTQAAELAALGVRHLVHVGTCGALGDRVSEANVIVATASYRDAAAVLLSNDPPDAIAPLSKPTPALTASLETVLKAQSSPYVTAIGYTMPIVYLQPEALRRALVTSELAPPGSEIGFIEMEQAPFFETCARLNVNCASIVVVSDRLTLKEDGTLTQSFEEATAVETGLTRALNACIGAFTVSN